MLSPFLALTTRLWPFLVRLTLMAMARTFIIWISLKTTTMVLVSVRLLLATVAFMWWRDVSREGLVGFHTSKLELSFRLGILFFIRSEVLFFVSFFWAFYDRSLSPVQEIGLVWPPMGVCPLSVYSLPLLNTVILLSSGVRVTWAHHSLINNRLSGTLAGLTTTVLLGVYFLLMQYREYCESSFSISDRIYGSTFFVRTGFHGIHVIVGTTILFYTLVHVIYLEITFNHHFMFEASAWYWHFVDVVWLFLYVSVYWWGSL